jgi:hypothetical protein
MSVTIASVAAIALSSALAWLVKITAGLVAR